MIDHSQTRTYQETLLLQQHTEIPSRVTVGLGLVNHDRIQQTLSTHGLDHGALDGLQSTAEDMAQFLGALNHLFLLNNLEGSDRDSATQGVTTVGRAVGTRFNGEHDVLAAQHTGHGIHAARDSLAQQDHVGLNAAPLVAEKLSSASNTGLDLITDQKGIVLVAKSTGFLQVVLIRDDNAGLSLNGFDQEGGEVGAGLLESLAQSGLVIVGDGTVRSGDVASNSGEVGTVVLPRLGVGRKRNGSELYSE